ncbi:MAG: VIT1/CCC1 transporter family protein [bacterium]|nr:VIT1/CCC1 transporter family protein [bacterium]
MNKSTYLKSAIFGIMDSLVSTVGFLAGIGAAGTSRSVIVMTGIIYASVEAFSMGVGDFLSEESKEQYEARGEVSNRKSVIAGIAMFFASLLAAFIPLAPYMLFDLRVALWVSISCSIVALFITGIISGRFSGVHAVRRGLKMALVGGVAIVIGVLVGRFLKV